MKQHIFIFLSLLITLESCEINTTTKKLTKEQSIISYYLLHPALFSDTLSRIIWKMPIDSRGIDVDKNLVYFVYPDSLKRNQVLNTITLDTSDVEFSTCVTGDCIFGGLQGNVDGVKVFRTPTHNLKIDTNLKFNCNLKKQSLPISLKELSTLDTATLTYPFENHIDLHEYYNDHLYASNIGSCISPKGKNKVIKRLLPLLINDEDLLEVKAQKLLNFVNFDYSYEDYWYQSEITKNSIELLLTGEADCSGLTTLYASLLEEANIPYCLLYYDRHVNVGVAGNFKTSNGYATKIDGINYFVAETTTPLFEIGMSKVLNDEILKHVIFYQIPSKSGNIYGIKNKKALSFIEISDEEE
jgi:hypothetical protein